MNNKRKFVQGENDHSPIYNKRSRPNDLCSSDEPRIDPTYGQRGAFPGLDDPHTDGELFYGPASDGLEYLRMVRSEAKTVPNLLVAPSSPSIPSEKDKLYADYPQGYYSDGAYTAIPQPHVKASQAHTREGQQEDSDPQEAYYESLCARFTKLTKVLQSPPSRAAADSNEVYYLDWTRSRLWRQKLLSTTPTMTILSQLTQESIICGLEVLESLLKLANLSGKRGKNIGAWTWGLLGKCREVGQMGSEEVGVLRNLGKQAVFLLRRLSAGEAIGGTADESDMEEGEEYEEDEEEEEAEEGEGDARSGEEGTNVRETADANDGSSPHINTTATAAVGQDSNSNNNNHDANPVSPTSVADLEIAKRQMLASLSHTRAQIDSTETKISNNNNNNHHGTRHPSTTPPPVPETAEGEFRGEQEQLPEERRRAVVEDEKEMIHATLDMLITIVGEFYGQRDLLDGRLLWDEM